MEKIIIIPDSFKGTMSSALLCEKMKACVLAHFPHAQVISIPIADGGEGTVDAFLATFPHSEKVWTEVTGPFFSPMQSFYGISSSTAVIEMAACAGLPLTKSNRNPCITTTYGVGQLIKDALDKGCNHILVGLGGSGTNDAGCGLAAALGIRFLNAKGEHFVPTGGSLQDVCHIDVSHLDRRIKETWITAICDIDNPLFGPNGAAYIFAPQKGADARMVEQLDQGLRHIDQVVRQDLGISMAEFPGTGAAGGCGFGLKTFLHAEMKMGIETLLDEVHFENLLVDADYVITGEGKIDGQSLRGKVVSGVARRARQAGVPVIAIVGDIGDEAYRAYEHGISAIFSTNRQAIDFNKARYRCVEDLVRCTDNLMRFIKTVESRTGKSDRITEPGNGRNKVDSSQSY